MGDSAHRPCAPAVRAAAALVAAAYGAASVLVATSEQRATSYLATERTQAAGLVAGVVLLGVGAGLVVLGDPERWGLLGLGLGLASLSPAWAGWEAGPSAVRSTAVVVAPLLVPVVVHAWWRAGPHGPRGTVDRVLVTGAYAGVALLVTLRALVHDPHRDRYCWVDCGPGANAFLVEPSTSLARGFGGALLLLVPLLTVVVTAATLRRQRWAADPARGAVALAAGAVLAGESAYSVVLLTNPVEQFDSVPGTALFWLRSALLAVLGLALGAAGLDAALRRRRVAALAVGLGGGPGGLDGVEARLARTMRDPSLRVDYWSAHEGRYVDARGRPAPGEDVPGRASVRVVHAGRPVAAIRHDPRRVGPRELAEQLGSGARLALDNERLAAERLAQLSGLRDSRTRLVEASDRHRRNLERDLHDGAQQRLIAATFELRLAAEEAADAGDDPLAGRLRAAVARCSEVLESLREFAHGVFPAVLDEAGLREALYSLADTAPRPVRIEYDVSPEPAETAARAAYLLAKAAVQSPSRDPDAEVVLRVATSARGLEVQALGVGPVELVHLADRVGAVGGTVCHDDSVLTAVLP